MPFRKKSTRELVQSGSPPPVPSEKGPKPEKPKKAKKEKKEKVPGLPWRQRLKSKVFLGGCCLTAAILLAFVITPAVASSTSATADVVVLTADADQGDQLKDSMLTVRQMGKLNLPKDAVTDPAEVKNMYLTRPMLAGEILTRRHIQAEYPTDTPQLLSLEKDQLAMSVALTDLSHSVSGKLRAGDIIQLFAVIDDADEDDTVDQCAAVPVPELQAVEVILVTDDSAAVLTGEESTAAAEERGQIATIVLGVSVDQAAVLAGLNANATLHAGLVCRGDEKRKAELLDFQQTVLSEKKGQDDEPFQRIPIPQSEGGSTP